MSRYLRLVKPTPPERIVLPGSTPTPARFAIDYPTWHAHLAGANGQAAPTPVATKPPVRLDPAATRPAA
jgi:hypothetical protein